LRGTTRMETATLHPRIGPLPATRNDVKSISSQFVYASTAPLCHRLAERGNSDARGCF